MTDDGLTDVEKAMLISLDALLMQHSNNAHAVTAGRIADLWGGGGKVFQRELSDRAELWKKRHLEVLRMAGDESSPCKRLMQLMSNPTGVDLDSSPPPKTPRRSRSKRPTIVRPSWTSRRAAGEMTDKEVQKFLELIDVEGISSVFDPGVCVMPDGVLLRPPLIVLDGTAVQYDDVAPLYERGEIERPWDPDNRVPEMALAFDFALLVIQREKKWTWPISDNYFRRLPWTHECKLTPEGRPGWKRITPLLEKAGLIERLRGQTWRLSREVLEVVRDTVTPQWIKATESGRS